MGRYDFKPLQVHKHAKQCLDTGKYKVAPCWYDVIGTVTPSQTLVRPQPVQHPLTRSRIKLEEDQRAPKLVETLAPRRKVKTKKASRIFKPVEISYEEDELRKDFFKHHPWELARPRVILESDGKDYLKHDWKTMKQSQKVLDGESVIQRQLWILHNVPNVTKADAYDQARREFYQLRLQEDVERRVAKEEAEATGAYFGISILEVGMDLEDREYSRWLGWADDEVKRLESARLAFSGSSEADGNSEEGREEKEAVDPVAPSAEESNSREQTALGI